MDIGLAIILLAGFASLFSALRTLNSNLNLQYDQNQKIIDLLTEIKQEIKKKG